MAIPNRMDGTTELPNKALSALPHTPPMSPGSDLISLNALISASSVSKIWGIALRQLDKVRDEEVSVTW